jgi:hypothetical protein
MFAAPTALFPFPFILTETLVILGKFSGLYRPSVYTIFLAGWLYIVVTIEITIQRNAVLRGSVEWTFGQVSSVFLWILNSTHNIRIDLPTCKHFDPFDGRVLFSHEALGAMFGSKRNTYTFIKDPYFS